MEIKEQGQILELTLDQRIEIAKVSAACLQFAIDPNSKKQLTLREIYDEIVLMVACEENAPGPGESKPS